jgi:hypothetical protein
MPSDADPETMNVDPLPGIWTPVQWDMSDEERLSELEAQATASLLFAVDVPEAMLRLLLDESEVEQTTEPPPGYDASLQGDWDPDLVTFRFKRPIRLRQVDRSRDSLHVEYDFQDLGRWVLDIEPERVEIYRA